MHDPNKQPVDPPLFPLRLQMQGDIFGTPWTQATGTFPACPLVGGAPAWPINLKLDHADPSGVLYVQATPTPDFVATLFWLPPFAPTDFWTFQFLQISTTLQSQWSGPVAGSGDMPPGPYTAVDSCTLPDNLFCVQL